MAQAMPADDFTAQDQARRAAEQAPRPLRVALFSGNYNYVLDGAARALNRLVGHLEDRGHQVLVFAPTTERAAFAYRGEVVSTPSIALPGGRGEYRLGTGLSAEARRRLADLDPNLIHVSAPDYLGLKALDYARSRRIPAVASFHTRFDTYPRYYGARWIEPYVTAYMRRFYQRCEHVYAPSPQMADELRADRIGRTVRLWGRGVDSAIFNPGRRDMSWRRSVGIADDDVAVAFVGRIVLEKGIEEFAAAIGLARAKAPSVRPLIVGDGPERARFQSLLPDAAFVGFLDGPDLARAYASSDIFLNPSVTETFGNVTLEAMACGTPPVCAGDGVTQHLVEHGVTGLLASPVIGAPAFAAAVATLATAPAERRRLAEGALSRSRGFNWPAILDGLLANYGEAIDGFRARP